MKMPALNITVINRPVEKARVAHHYAEADLAAMREHNARERARREALEALWLAEEDPPPLPEPIETVWDNGNIAVLGNETEIDALRKTAFEAWLARRSGAVAAAVRPLWINTLLDGWLIGIDEQGPLSIQPTAVSLILNILLPPDGEMALRLETRKSEEAFLPTRINWPLSVRARTEHGLHRGNIHQHADEMTYWTVIFPAGTPQAVVDRVAAVFGHVSSMDMPTDFPAILPPGDRCDFCHRRLNDPSSKVLRIGPDCAAHMGIPHGDSAADRVLTARAAFVAELTGAGS
jgi:Family of unknown function (DUF6011)